MPRFRIVIKAVDIGNWSADVDGVDSDEAIYAAIDAYLATPNRSLKQLRWDALPTARIQVVDRWDVSDDRMVG